jgi:23S rRNA pseudouridine1911/1915/1917 synthase
MTDAPSRPLWGASFEDGDAEDSRDTEDDEAPRNAAGDVIELRIKVPPTFDGWRLDHFLKWRIGRLSRTKIQEIIRTQITLDGRAARASTPVREGETFLLRRPAPVEPEVPRTFDVLYEDDVVRVIDKPAGLPMHTTAKFWKNTLVAVLRERYPGAHNEIAHRIDRETSGALVIARTPAAGAFLKKAFAERRVEKHYLALVKGRPPDAFVVDAPLKLLDTPSRLMMGVAEDGLPARTRFKVLEALPHHALVEARPETGRQHQIRVHLASRGHPILGDKLYGASEADFMRACDEGLTPELLARFDGLSRQALHAARITFPHPLGGQTLTVESPLPPDLVATWQRLAATLAEAG